MEKLFSFLIDNFGDNLVVKHQTTVMVDNIAVKYSSSQCENRLVCMTCLREVDG